MCNDKDNLTFISENMYYVLEERGRLDDAIKKCIKNGIEIHTLKIGDHEINVVKNPKMKENEVKIIE